MTEQNSRPNFWRNAARMRDSADSNPTAARTGTPTLKKADLTGVLCDHIGLNAREAKEMVEAFFEVMLDALEGGEHVKLPGFGNFRLRDKSPRPGRNPKTGDATLIAARRIVTFQASQKLKALTERGQR